MGQQPGGFRHEIQAPPEEILSGAHLSQRARGLWQHPAAQDGRHFVCIHLVIFGLATVDRHHKRGHRTRGIPSCVQRSASQYQVNMHATETTTSSRKGCNTWRKALGSVRLFPCVPTSPSASMTHLYIQSTCPSMPQ